MMGRKFNYVFNAFLFVSTTVFADTPVFVAAAPAINVSGAKDDAQNSLADLSAYLQNLGEYFGYDVTAYCTTGGPCSTPAGGGPPPYSNTLFDSNATYSMQLNLFNTFLGAIIGNSSQTSPDFNPIVPPSNNYSLINTLAGQTYLNPAYNDTTSTTGVSVSTLIDQQNYQSDPVSQAILNIIATPNYTYCQQNNSQDFIPNCPFLFRELIMSNVVGTLEGTQNVFTTGYNQPLVPQLNADTLLSPLLFSTTPLPTNPNSSDNSSTRSNPGLTATTQAQQAANLIRYVISQTNPLSLINRSTYDSLVNVAENYSKNSTPQEQVAAKIKLTNYMTRVRTYAAQISFPISNFYYAMSKRIPQAPISGNGKQTSQALNEFIMASWRLYNPNQGGGSGDKQWLTNINQASAATVQKEIAVLLAEINYQLYLDRQIQERILLTQSVGVIQNTLMAKPDPTMVDTSAIPQNSNTSSS